MKHVLMFAASEGDGGGGSGGDDFDAAVRLRGKALRLGKILIWHVEHSSLAVWIAAAKLCDLEWPFNVLHALHKYRPKRQATSVESAEIARRYKARTRGEPHPNIFRLLANDPDWHLFELSLDAQPPKPYGEI